MLSQNFTQAISAQNLEVTFDNIENFRQHISQTCHCCFYHIRDLRCICHIYLYIIIATALVSSRLDYCNSLYHNIAPKDILKLQHVQNCLVRVVTQSTHFFHSLPLIKSLHWLPVRYHMHFHPSNQHIYNHCSLLQDSPDSFDHLILVW